MPDTFFPASTLLAGTGAEQPMSSGEQEEESDSDDEEDEVMVHAVAHLIIN